MLDNRVYWIWLQQAFGAGSIKPVTIYKRFNNLEEFYKGGKKLWSQFEFITEKNLSVLNSFSLEQAEYYLEYSLRFGQEVCTYDCKDYPQKLRNIYSPPAVLYTKGSIPNFDDVLTITVVGSRNADVKSQKITEEICYNLSKKGVVIASGGAVGIDRAAHIGSLQGTGVNACILACGLDYPYLMENHELRRQIIGHGGCLISEYPQNTPVYKGSFSVRNRIMSGLSDGVLVVRAKEKSGTNLTINHAIEQNKDIFAIPGDIDDPYAVTPNRLIKDGAIPVLNCDDILNNYPNFTKISFKKINAKEEYQRKDVKNLSENAKLVYSCITIQPIHITKICQKTGLSSHQVQIAITELELTDYITTYSGQRCSLAKN